MKKILIITTIPRTLAAFFLPFARYFRARGWQVDALSYQTSQSEKCVEAFDNVWDVDWSRNPFDPKNLLAAPGQIRQIVAAEGYDIIQVSTPIAAFVTRYALSKLSNRQRTKVVYTALGFHFYQGGSAVKNAIYKKLETIAGKWTDYLVTVNREDREAVGKYAIVPAARLRYIPSGLGINFDKFDPQSVTSADIAQVYQAFGMADQDTLLLSIAEFIARKRPQDVLQAFALLQRRLSDPSSEQPDGLKDGPKDRPAVHLAMAGDGPMLEDMKQLASSLKIADRVHFLGFRRDIPILIRSAAAIVLASEHEGLPVCAMESLCLATPVIGTDIRGTQDLLADGGGLLVPTANVPKLAEAMYQVVAHPEAAIAMGQKGRASMNQYELNRILGMYESLYQEAIGTAGDTEGDAKGLERSEKDLLETQV